MSNESLKNTVSRILRTPGMEKIGFQLGALMVTGANIGRVAQAIDAGRIECRVVGQIKADGPISPGKGNVIEARYKEELNAMLFRDDSYGTAPGEDRTVVHEAVHASFDLLAPRSNFKTLAIDDESAAILTEAIYIKVCNRPVGGFKMVVGGPQEEAWNLAGLMSAATDEFTKGGIYTLDPTETTDLRAAVAKDWGFVKVKDKTGYTDNTTAIYIYNGMVRCGKSGVCN
jgi:hypothetical protein